MRFFTPDLLERFASADDQIADAANDEWEAATQTYADHLRKIRKHFPKQLKQLLQRFYFHDAKISFIGMCGQTLHLTLQLDTPPHPMVFIRYGLTEEIKTVLHSIDGQGPERHWLYDEIDLVSDAPFPILQHSILCSDGLEIVIQFQTLHFSSAQYLDLAEDLGTVVAPTLIPFN